jgi:multidrug efflux pump subunit AcrA (membrane-fusion protein)
VSDYLGESEQKLAQPGSAELAIVAKRTSRSERIVAIFLGATLTLGIFFALRSQKHKVDSAAAGAEDHSVIVHVGTAYQGDMGVYINALGTVTPISTVNIYSQVSGQVLAVHYREGQMNLAERWIWTQVRSWGRSL